MKKGPARQLVLDLLSRSTCRVQMAAVISDSAGRIVSWGWNHSYVHAEEHALSRANPKRLKGATITVAGRRASSGGFVHACPCEREGKDCYQLIEDRGLTQIVFRNKAGQWIEVKAND